MIYNWMETYGKYFPPPKDSEKHHNLFMRVSTSTDYLPRTIFSGQSPAEADLNLLETARRCELYGTKMHGAKVSNMI